MIVCVSLRRWDVGLLYGIAWNEICFILLYIFYLSVCFLLFYYIICVCFCLCLYQFVSVSMYVYVWTSNGVYVFIIFVAVFVMSSDGLCARRPRAGGRDSSRL